MALGASSGDVLWSVFSSMAASVGGGLLAGIVLTVALSNALARWAEGSSRDAFVLLGAAVVLSAVAAFACAGPARRASGTDPMAALRYE
jgi:ABC-type antimicrobial peptide transport system permease subunit